MIKANKHIAAMDTYALPVFDVAAGKPVVALAQNESFRPPSQKALAVGQAAVNEMLLYPDSGYQALTEAIATNHGLKPDGILCAAGSMELIAALAQAYLSEKRSALSTQYSYAFFRTATALVEADFLTVPEREYQVSVDHLLLAVKNDTTVVFVANPGNPTGTRIPKADLLRLRENLRDDILLVIDEAYGEFADYLGEPTFDMVETGNTVVLRTFSKAYGLAGARVGWGYFPSAIKGQLQKIINPGSISAVSQAMATAAKKDQSAMKSLCKDTSVLREKFSQHARSLGLEVPESHTNFALLLFESAEAASLADKALRAEAIILRGMVGYGLPQALRATIGTEEQMDFVIKVLKQQREQGK